MLLAFIRFAMILFILLSLIYIAAMIWARAAEIRRLEAEWREAPEGNQRDHIRAGLDHWRGSWQRRLLLGVYIIPICGIAAVIYFNN